MNNDEKLAIAIEALEYYADRDTWERLPMLINYTKIPDDDNGETNKGWPPYSGGKRARAALEKIKKFHVEQFGANKPVDISNNKIEIVSNPHCTPAAIYLTTEDSTVMLKDVKPGDPPPYFSGLP